MLKGLFVTGTDTGVGKTVVAAALMHRYRHLGLLRYWKPVQTGIEQDDDTEAVRCLGACGENEIRVSGVRLRGPVAPYLAARLSGTSIRTSDLFEKVLPADGPAPRWVVEGAGGALVPLNDTEMMIDLMARFSMPVLVVARSTLGTINHTLLTLEALRSRVLDVAGVVIVGDTNRENRHAIERYGAAHVLAEMPKFSSLTSETLKQWSVARLDPESRLARCFS
jgi:dethiobiotin synthase